MLNVVAVGDNVAISAIEVEEVEACPTVWMYTDSTGCDYAALQPFFPLQNYGGTVHSYQNICRQELQYPIKVTEV